MKRYLVFRYDSYYPCGGMSDCEFQADTLKECNEYIAKCEKEPERYMRYDNIEIFDTETMRLHHIPSGDTEKINLEE